MSQLPNDRNLPIQKLVACFNNTSTTYKYYWLLALIQAVESGRTLIYKHEMFSRMISSAWYTVNYYHISFGKQDMLQRAIENIKTLENLSIDLSQDKILNQLISTTNQDTITELHYFNKQVPHWFLSPWFPKSSSAEIYNYSKEFKGKCLYALHPSFIQINLLWVNYLLENAALIKNFCYWNLSIYLQTKNPNVPDIPNKIIKPATRNSLSKQRKFWDIVFEEEQKIECIYTGNTLLINNYAVEHFVPYRFVSHDLIWNLIPADKIFNSSKSDKLPQMDKYFNSFYQIQKKAIKIVKDKQPRNKFLEEYLTIFPNINELDSLDSQVTLQSYRDKIQPLITIANNNGFSFM